MAQTIIDLKEHVVELSCGEELTELDCCKVRVQAAPVELLLPSALEVGPEGCGEPQSCPGCAPASLCPSKLVSARLLVPAQLGTLVLQLQGQPCPGPDQPAPPADRADSEQQDYPGV